MNTQQFFIVSFTPLKVLINGLSDRIKFLITLLTGFILLCGLASCTTGPARDGGYIPDPVAVPAPPATTNPLSDGKIRLSLEQCIQVALDNNRPLAISRAGRQKARGRVKEVNSMRYPQLTGSLSYTRLDEVTEFNMGGKVTTIGSQDNYKAEASARQILYQGGKVTTLIDSAKLGEELADAQFADTEEMVIFLVARAYYDVLLAEATLKVDQKSLETTTAHRDNVKSMNQQGMASNYELLRAEVQVSNLKSLEIQSESNRKLARLNLLRVIGAPTENNSTEVELTDNLTYKAIETNEEQLLETAFKMRPDLKQAQLMVDIQRKSIKIAKADLRPTVSLFASAGEESPSRKVFGAVDWGDYWNAGVTISFPIFEAGRTRARVSQEKATLHQYQIALEDTEEKARYEIRQAILTLKDTEELINSQEQNVKQAEEGLRLAELGYRNGVNTQVEVMDAQTARDMARKNYLYALYQYNVARLMLNKATGVLR